MDRDVKGVASLNNSAEFTESITNSRVNQSSPAIVQKSKIISPDKSTENISWQFNSFISPETSSSNSGSSQTEKNSQSDSTASMPSQNLEEPVKEEQIWGSLIAIDKNFHSFSFVESKDTYTFGRCESCDYSFDTPVIRQSSYFNSYSKKHFSICRDRSANDSYKVWIQDHGSKNGLYIGNYHVESNLRAPLKPNDRISVICRSNVLFMYTELPMNITNPCNPLSLYHKEDVIADGRYGSVVKAKHVTKPGYFAIKSVKKIEVYGHGIKRITKEATILKKIQHPCIIKMIEAIEQPDALHMVLEYIPGGELFDRLSAGKKMEIQHVKIYFYQLLLAVEYLHSLRIIHRDIKPQNILMMSYKDPCLLKLSDFGVSHMVDDDSVYMSSMVGTQLYLAPELLDTSEGYGLPVDVWSLGVILYFCLLSYLPFKPEREDTGISLRTQILTGSILQNKDWKGLEPETRDLIKSLICVDVEKRSTASVALNHRWLKDESKTVRSLMEVVVSSPVRTNLKRSFISSESSRRSKFEKLVNS